MSELTDVGPRRSVTAALFAIILALGAVAYYPVLFLEHLGWDTLPMIATSRVQGFGDFVGNFTEKMMDGRYPRGDFYRPLANLSLAWDWMWWGLDPFGYHLTGLLILAACSLALAAFAWRLFGSRWVGIFAAGVFLLHPVHFEALPVAARRSDPLSLLFLLLTLCALPRAGAGWNNRRAWLAAAGAFCAAGTKEIGVIAGPLCLALALIEAGGSPVSRARAALAPSALPIGATALFLGLRTYVLDGLGGHPDTSVLEGLRNAPALLPAYGSSLLMPQPLSAQPTTNEMFVTVAAIAWLSAALLLLALRSATPSTSRARATAGLIFLCVWLACVLVLTGISGEIQSWYGVPFLAVYGLAFGFVAGGAVTGLRRGSLAVGACAASAALLLGWSGLRYSGLSHDYTTWDRVSRWERIFLDDLRGQLARAKAGDRLVVRNMPPGLMTPPHLVGVRMAAGMSDYTVQAWVEMVFPGLEVRVQETHGVRPTIVYPGEIVVGVVPGNSPPP